MNDNFDKNENITNENSMNAGDAEHHDKLHSEQASDISHNHGHAYGSHHGSKHGSHHGSHHSSHHRSKSSSHQKKRGGSQKKSVFDRIEQKIGYKRLMVISLVAALLSIVFIGSVFLYESFYLQDYSDTPNTNDSQENDPPDYSDQHVSTPFDSSLTVPSYWKDMVNQKTKVVKALQTDGGKDCVSFVWASDTHIPDNSTARTSNLGVLMAAMMDNCDIPFAVLTGDIGTRASHDTEAELLKAQENIPVHLAPLPLC